MAETAQGITVRSIAASINAETGERLDTFSLRYPRMVHADFMTHRVFSRNASSSRAIPVKSLVARDADIYIPEFRKNKKGMQPGAHLEPARQLEAEAVWTRTAQACAEAALQLADLGVHKQWANRMLEWFGYIDVVVSATDWKNFFHLRHHEDAQDEIMHLAEAIEFEQENAVVQTLRPGEWHTPWVDEAAEARLRWAASNGRLDDQLAPVAFAFEDPQLRYLTPMQRGEIAVSVARSCRVSYSKHDGSTATVEEDVDLFVRLAGEQPIHASPLEHQATPVAGVLKGELSRYQGNLKGFAQFRKLVPGEAI